VIDEKGSTEDVPNSLYKLNTDPSSIIAFGNKLIAKATELIVNADNPTISDYMIADGALFFFWLLFKKYVIDQKDHMYNVEALKSLLLSVTELLNSSVRESK